MFARSIHVIRNIILHLAVAFLSISVHFLLLIHKSYSGGTFLGQNIHNLIVCGLLHGLFEISESQKQILIGICL